MVCGISAPAWTRRKNGVCGIVVHQAIRARVGAMLAHHGLTVKTAGSSAPEWTRHGVHHCLNDYRRAIRAHVGTTPPFLRASTMASGLSTPAWARLTPVYVACSASYPRPCGRDTRSQIQRTSKVEISAPEWARQGPQAPLTPPQQVIRACVDATAGSEVAGRLPRDLSAPEWARRRHAAGGDDHRRVIRARVGATRPPGIASFSEPSYLRPRGRECCPFRPSKRSAGLSTPAWARLHDHVGRPK